MYDDISQSYPPGGAVLLPEEDTRAVPIRFAEETCAPHPYNKNALFKVELLGHSAVEVKLELPG